MKQLFIVGLLCIAGSLYAQTTMFVGGGLEANGNAPHGAALGVSVASDVYLNPKDKHLFSAGLRIGYSNNMNTLSNLETSALFRYYLPVKVSGFFVQADLGASIFFENGGSYPAFLGGLTAGWRYRGNHWFIEPFARGGYPFIWGVGLQAGTSFDLKGGKK